VRGLCQGHRPGDGLMQIRPTGEDRTVTRESLMACRDEDARRMRERWAQEKIDKQKEEEDE